MLLFSFSRRADGHPGYSCCHQQRARGERTWPGFRLRLLQQLLSAVSFSVLQQPVQLSAVPRGLDCWISFRGHGKPSWGIPGEEQPSQSPSALYAWAGRKPVAGKMLPREWTGYVKTTHTQTRTCRTLLVCISTLYERCKEFFSLHIRLFNLRHCLQGTVKKYAYICVSFHFLIF